MRHFAAILALGLPLLALFGSGCKPKAQPVAPPPPPAYKTLVRLHWLGKQRITADTNSAYFLSLLNLPEAVQLQNQTLDKLASGVGSTPTNSIRPEATNSALRPLLDDLLEAESFLEVRQAPGQKAEAALAIKLPDDRARLWQTNLASLEGSLLQRLGSNRLETFARDGWLLVGLPGSTPLASNLLTKATAASADASGVTNYWLEADLDSQWLVAACGGHSPLPASLPQVHLTLLGEGEYVRTRARLDFPKPLDLQLEPWNIPTNLIREPLISFTALQGLRPGLAHSAS